MKNHKTSIYISTTPMAVKLDGEEAKDGRQNPSRHVNALSSHHVVIFC